MNNHIMLKCIYGLELFLRWAINVAHGAFLVTFQCTHSLTKGWYLKKVRLLYTFLCSLVVHHRSCVYMVKFGSHVSWETTTTKCTNKMFLIPTCHIWCHGLHCIRTANQNHCTHWSLRVLILDFDYTWLH